jgi:23S rRNA (guanosine2251-2'-O)-methyltransferase
LLELKNPHSILAALDARPRDVTEIRLTMNQPSGAWADVVELAEQHQVAINHVRDNDRSGGGRRNKNAPKTERVGVASALIKEHSGVDLNHLLRVDQNAPSSDADCESDNVPHPGLWLALDCLYDPHNVGAIIRTAGFFGVRGVVLTKDRSAPLNSTVYDVAAGGMEAVPFSIVQNLSRTIDVAKKNGLWLLGTSEHAKDDISEIKSDRPWLLVLGNEEKGLRRLTQDSCDMLCSIKGPGSVTSLNVSVAAAVCISQLAR